MLRVCHEARELGLVIYKRVGGSVPTRAPCRNIPIYMNPEFDIIWRGKDSCSVGYEFQIRCINWVEPSELARYAMWKGLVRPRRTFLRVGAIRSVTQYCS
jgi:hypothetical protein